MSFRSFDPKDLETTQLHSYLLGAVAPRPIALASTIDKQGGPNLSPFSFFNAFSSNPPILVFSPSRRGRDNTTKDTYENVKKVPEVVISVVDYAMVEQVSLSSNEYPSHINEFEKAGFTPIPSEKVRPPRVKESPVSFECTVQEVKELGTDGGAGNLIICQIQFIHIQEQHLNQRFELKLPELDLVGRMGANWYVRASGEALFEVEKPAKAVGMGIDQLPWSVRQSTILTGNDLGRLGSLEQIPDLGLAIPLLENPEVAAIWEHLDDKTYGLDSLHKLAQHYLELGQIEKALLLLLLPELKKQKSS